MAILRLVKYKTRDYKDHPIVLPTKTIKWIWTPEDPHKNIPVFGYAIMDVGISFEGESVHILENVIKEDKK